MSGFSILNLFPATTALEQELLLDSRLKEMSTMGSAMNYSERPYENHMTSHCQSGSYPSYQPPSPYRPHPVSPPAHAHQYGAHGGHQMHGGLGAYGSGHQLGPYSSAPSSHYASLGPPDLYGGRPPSMYGSGRAMQQMKSAWGGESNSGSSADLMQYSQPSPRPMMPPPPSMHSPPHGGIGGSGNHGYRQVPIVTPPGAGHSPHSWSQSQIPSPGTGVLHSPRTTPSPLPAHTRSPAAGAQPFSPPPAAPSPQQQPQHHPPPSMTPHPPPPHKTTPSPPSGATTPAPNSAARQTVCESPSGTQGPANSDPLQSLQKMVMLDSETVESPITRANYEMAANQAAAGGTPNAPVTGRPASYFSVEQLAGNEPGSPYPTYYNLDQNRLCTPPRTNLSTPTSSTFSSAPDSASSNSPRSDSRTTTASADSNHVAHVNGDVSHHAVNPIAGPIPTDTPQPPPPPPPPPRRPDFGDFGVAGMRMTNGNHQPDAAGLRDELGGPVSSDSENKDTQDFLQHLGGPVAPLPEPDGTVDLRRKSPKSPRGRRRVFGHDLQCDPLMDGAMDISRKPMMMPPEERRNTLPEFETLNGKPESCDNVYPTDGGYAPRPPRYYSPTNRWNKMGPLEDGFMGMQQSKPYPDEYLPMPKPSKRGRKKKMFEQDGIVSEWDMYNSEIVHRPPRISRGGSRGRRGSRRRGAITSYPANNGDVPMDMYSSDPMMTMRNHPSNGMGDMVGTNSEKDLPWGSQNYHMGPPSSGMGSDYGSKDGMSVIKPPMIDSHSMDNSSMNNNLAQSQPPPNYQSDVPSDDRGRGPLLFTVNKDGSTVKLQDNGQTNSSSVQQQQYYDPVLGQMVPQPMKKKRGRPFGSKNKPKPPGEERQPRRRRKKEVFFGPEGPPPTSLIKRRLINGPYVHIVGVRNKPLVVSVVNAHPKDENSDSKYWPQKQPLQFGGVIRQNLGMGTSPGLPHIYDTITKDRSWLCSLCCKNSHYRGLGDLFGPYYLNGDQKPSNYSSPPSPAPMSTFGNESSEPGEDFEPEDSRECPPDPSSCSDASGMRRYPGKRKSDVMEQMFRAALLRKAKQANGQKPLEEMSNHMSGVDMSHSNPNQFPVDTPPTDNKEFWVHEECAVWSRNVYLFGHRLRGLEETVLQSVDKLCSRCKFPGASLSCACENCPELYHYLCARDNWCYMDEDTYTIYCPQHKVKPFIIRVGEDQIEELELNAKR